MTDTNRRAFPAEKSDTVKPVFNPNTATKPVAANAITIAAYNAVVPLLKVATDSQGKSYNPAKISMWGIATNQESGEIFPGRALRGMVDGFRKSATLAAAATAFLEAVVATEAFDTLGDGRPYFRALSAALAAAAKLGPLLDAEAVAKAAAEKAARVREALLASGMTAEAVAALLG